MIMLLVMLKTKEKKKIIESTRVHDKDTGSAEVQVGLLSKQIDSLTDHLKRKKLLTYVSKTNKAGYEKLIKKLGLRK